MAPIVHGLEADYAGKIQFTYLDIDDPANDEFKKALNFRTRPYFVLLDAEGKIIQQWIGPVKAEEFEKAFEGIK
jgi:hypothetical protein